jgi:hypothetical protein
LSKSARPRGMRAMQLAKRRSDRKFSNGSLR